MAELVFAKVYTNSSTGLSDICIGNEPDSTITKFFVESHRQGNHLGDVVLSNYDNVAWNRKGSLMTTQEVTAIGIKTFPQIGAIGFYRLKYEPKSLILAPVYTRSKTYEAPIIEVTKQTDSIYIKITNPSNVTYDCFRIVVRKGYFAEEYVTYETEITVPLPAESGVYAISAFGYLDERLASKESEIYYLATESPAEPAVYSAVLGAEDGKVLVLGDTAISIT